MKLANDYLSLRVCTSLSVGLSMTKGSSAMVPFGLTYLIPLSLATAFGFQKG